MSMYKSKPLLLALYRMINASLLSLSMTGVLSSYLGIWQAKASHVAVTVLLIGLLTWFHYGKSNEKIISIIAVIGIICVWIPMLTGCSVGELLGTYFKWLMSAEGYNQAWSPGYELLQVVWMSMLCYLVFVLAEKGTLLKGISGFLVIALLVLNLILGFWVQKLFVAAAITYAAIAGAEVVQKYWKKQKSGDKREYLLFLMPCFALYMVLMLLMPYSEQPYDWKLFRDIYANVSEKITVMAEGIIRNGQEDFGSSIAGFSEDGKLALRISGRTKDLMSVQGDRNLYTNVYLTGKIYDTFDGREWTKQIQETTDTSLDTLELVYGVRNFDPDLMNNYFKRSVLRVQYKSFHTEYLFAPSKWITISEEHKQILGEEVLFDKKVGYGTRYDVAYYQLNLNADCFEDLLRSKVTEDTGNWEYVRYHYGNNQWPHYTVKDLEEHRKIIKTEYAKEITLTDKVTEILNTLFADCSTDYDKMKALEAYLSDMEYTTSPGKLPDWVDSQESFAEYFYTEGKRGYCSYFATAFVLVARAQGLPARYVEGFCVPLAKDKEMIATTDMTHAWPEVYFEGVGWIPFEPTPGYSGMRYSGWKVKQPKQDSQVDYSDISGNPYQNPEEEEPPQTEPDKETPTTNWDAVCLWTASLAGLVAGCVVILLLERALQRHRFAALSIEKQFEKRIQRMLWIWTKLGYRRSGEETLQELQDRICMDWEVAPLPLQKPQMFREAGFLKLYQEYRYGNLIISKEHVESIRMEEQELLEHLRDTRKWLYLLAWLRM